jgi:hypothetical protein
MIADGFELMLRRAALEGGSWAWLEPMVRCSSAASCGRRK